MKKIVGCIAMALVFFACESETDTNRAKFEAEATNETVIGHVEYGIWRPDWYKATVANPEKENSILFLEGQTDSTSVFIKMKYDAKDFGQPVFFGEEVDVNKEAYAEYIFKDVDGTEIARYKTIVHEIGVASNGYGKVILDDGSKQTPGTLSGIFDINLYKYPGNDTKLTEPQKEKYKTLATTKSFSKGFFLKVPLSAAN